MKTRKWKVIIAGSRTFRDYEKLKKVCDRVLDKLDKVEIVSGAARGADRMGEAYALTKRYDIKLFPADWDTHGKSAGYRRNVEMAKYADMLIVFWDGSSRGTKHMIDIAKKENLPTHVEIISN